MSYNFNLILLNQSIKQAADSMYDCKVVSNQAPYGGKEGKAGRMAPLLDTVCGISEIQIETQHQQSYL